MPEMHDAKSADNRHARPGERSITDGAPQGLTSICCRGLRLRSIGRSALKRPLGPGADLILIYWTRHFWLSAVATTRCEIQQGRSFGRSIARQHVAAATVAGAVVNQAF